MVRDCATSSDAIIATDQAIVPAVLRHLPVDSNRVHLIPNGIDVGDLGALVEPAAGRAVRAEAGIADDETLLVSVGRLEANKGFGDLAEALASGVVPAGWRWVLVGDGPERRTLEATIERLRIANRVRLVGRADDRTLHAWYDAADLFVHPTRYEGSSLVTLEAMLHALPVVATRAGGLPDKVLPGRTGWLTDPGSPKGLAETLRQAVVQRDRWPAYGVAGRQLLDNEFDWRVLQRKFEVLYRRLIAG